MNLNPSRPRSLDDQNGGDLFHRERLTQSVVSSSGANVQAGVIVQVQVFAGAGCKGAANASPRAVDVVRGNAVGEFDIDDTNPSLDMRDGQSAVDEVGDSSLEVELDFPSGAARPHWLVL